MSTVGSNYLCVVLLQVINFAQEATVCHIPLTKKGRQEVLYLYYRIEPGRGKEERKKLF